jgi:predicted glycoside hydrolase/deacetylase ChbG (UPF0249 family)
MVFMTDSERAAELALSSGIDVGLHVNLSEPFSGEGVPLRLRDCQEQICRFLNASKYALLLYDPSLAGAFRHVFRAQHEEFVRLFGREPSHIDGHQHMHLSTNMLVGRILPQGAKVRRNFSFGPGEKGFVNRWYRSAVDKILARRHRLTDHFFALSSNLTFDRLARLTALAQSSTVELMSHPHRAEEFAVLMSDAYGEAVSAVKFGSFESFPGTHLGHSAP